MNNSYLTLHTKNDLFTLTQATIQESLEQPFVIHCEGFYSSIQSDLYDMEELSYQLIDKNASLIIDSTQLHQDKTFHSTHLINQTHNTLSTPLALQLDSNNNNTTLKSPLYYEGLISKSVYLGSHKDELNLSNSLLKSINTLHFFRFELHSVLFRLAFEKNNRIFTHKSCVEVLKELLDLHKDHLHKDFDFSGLRQEFKKEEFIIQYNESDLDFLIRITHNNGIYFYEQGSSMYFYSLCINGENLPHSQQHFLFNPKTNNTGKEECIYHLTRIKTLQSNHFTMSSRNTGQPFLFQAQEFTHNNTQNLYSEHHYSSAHSFTQNADLHTLISLKQKRSLMLDHLYEAQSNIFNIQLHQVFGISTSFNEEAKEYIAIQKIQHLVDNTLLLSGSIHDSDQAVKPYSNTLTLIPSNISFVASIKNKPNPPSMTQGIVLGKSNTIQDELNTLYTDEYSRIRVRLNAFMSLSTYQQLHKNSEHTPYYSDTAFLRVLSPIASQSSGFYAIPRVGDEVIVSFLDNDIDKPVVTASLYNLHNPALSHIHQTSLSSKTIGLNETGYNELSFSNLKDQEQVYLRAQKDYDELIQHNFTQRILNDKASVVKGHFNETIEEFHIQNIALAKNVNIGGEYLSNIALSKDTQVGLSNTLNIGANNKLRVAKESSEYVGENKRVEVGGDLNTLIEKDERREIKGNRREIVGGNKQEHTEGNLTITSQSQGNIYTQKGLYVESQTLSFQAKDVSNIESDSVGIDAQSDCAIQAGNQILHQVGETQILAKGDSVIIKAGGVEVVIDSKGLVVKGGEVKAE